MLAVAPLALSLVAAQDATYKIVEIDRQSVFAGKLGRLVHESLVVERDGKRYTINVRGDYHTMCLHPRQRFHQGDQIRLSANLADSASVDRDSIKRG